MLITIIIVSFNAREALRGCLASLPGSAPGYYVETIVVDNASSNGNVDMVRAEFPHVMVLTNERNVGFAAANNQALAVAKGDFLLLLNGDTVVHDDALV